jgi:hypothetical protein
MSIAPNIATAIGPVLGSQLGSVFILRRSSAWPARTGFQWQNGCRRRAQGKELTLRPRFPKVKAAIRGTVMHLFAYIDPGSGLLVWQLIVAVAVGCLFYMRKFRDGLMHLARKLIKKD